MFMHSRDDATIREVNRIILSFLRKYGLPGITVYISEGMRRNNSGTEPARGIRPTIHWHWHWNCTKGFQF